MNQSPMGNFLEEGRLHCNFLGLGSLWCNAISNIHLNASNCNNLATLLHLNCYERGDLVVKGLLCCELRAEPYVKFTTQKNCFPIHVNEMTIHSKWHNNIRNPPWHICTNHSIRSLPNRSFNFLHYHLGFACNILWFINQHYHEVVKIMLVWTFIAQEEILSFFIS
jgi:hypothetical protein